jgi:hypothetical protein
MKLEHLILLFILLVILYKLVSSNERYSLMPTPKIECKKKKGCEIEFN